MALSKAEGGAQYVLPVLRSSFASANEVLRSLRIPIERYKERSRVQVHRKSSARRNGRPILAYCHRPWDDPRWYGVDKGTRPQRLDTNRLYDPEYDGIHDKFRVKPL